MPQLLISCFFLILIIREVKSDSITDILYYYLIDDEVQKTDNSEDVSGKQNISFVMIDLKRIAYVNKITISQCEHCDPSDKLYANIGTRFKMCKIGKSSGNIKISEFDCVAFARKIKIQIMKSIFTVEIDGHETHIEKYVGCFEDVNERAINFTTSECSSSKCSTPFYATKIIFGLVKMYHCACISQLTDLKPVELSLCNKACNRGHACGGAISFSIYSASILYKYKSTIEQPNECIYNNKDCLDCPQGWFGPMCEFLDSNFKCTTNEQLQVVDVDGLKVYRCKCLEGYSVNNFIQCIDIDECARDSCSTINNTKCRNEIGSYACDCLKGYKRNGPHSEFSSCYDINECETGKCDKKTTKCENTPGSYVCHCLPGFKKPEAFRGDMETCDDIDECLNKSACPRRSNCTNKFGSYECVCHLGFNKTHEGLCEDVDECETRTSSLCTPFSTICVNLVGTYDCICNAGYHKKNGSVSAFQIINCLDLDECSTNMSFLCNPSTTTCVNRIGTYNCNCKSGFDSISGNVSANVTVSCKDVDECETRKSFLCNPSTTTCLNLVGTYDCNCIFGFDSKSGSVSANKTVSCEDFDECAHGKSFLCNPSTTTCVNRNGTYDCNCKGGYDSKRGSVSANVTVSCKDVDECAPGKTSLCNPSATACVNLVGTYDCNCKSGFDSKRGNVSANIAVSCEDINECADRPCDADTTICNNVPGAFKCDCRDGYTRIAQRMCKDIDECEDLGNYCGKMSTCRNSPGSYDCDCPEGTFKTVYKYTVECKDRDECLDSPCDLDVSFCLNTRDGYICHCKPGYINIDKLTCKTFTRTTTTFNYDEEYEDEFTTTQESTLLTEDNIFVFYIVLIVAVVMSLLAAAFYFYFSWMSKKKKPDSGASSSANSPPLSVSNL